MPDATAADATAAVRAIKKLQDTIPFDLTSAYDESIWEGLVAGKRMVLMAGRFLFGEEWFKAEGLDRD